MRQYRIVTSTPETEPTTLEPGTHAALYNIPEIRTAIAFVRENQRMEFVGIRIDARRYSIVVTYADALLDNHFELKDSNG
ncbi:MAG: hypothetical protein ACW99J_19060 [Candidatus Thorarchaeota archaeon]|jgi:hypothetical protein